MLSGMDELIAKLYAVKAVKFGSYTLKSGLVSPIYFDLRVTISYPDLLETISELLWKGYGKPSIDLVCGVPYTALPMATVISVKNKIPMLLRRKEAKGYGTKKLIEGDFQPGQQCLIIEDVVTSGTSILQTAKELRREGLVITDAVVLLDRQQGGTAQLAQHGIRLHTVISIKDFMLSLERQGLTSSQVVADVLAFIGANPEGVLPENPRLKETLTKRMSSGPHPQALRLMQLMELKQSNLCVAADLPKLVDVIKLADLIGPKIAVLKIHVDIFEDFSAARIDELEALSKKHNFLIMEDRKFGDIANTSQLQYHGGVFNISRWADLITVHPLPGPHLITNIMGKADRSTCGIVPIFEMSSQGALTKAEYRAEAAKWVADDAGAIAGFVGQSSLAQDDHPGWIQFTPGVSLSANGDNKGQQYTSPADAVEVRGADVIIVGRGIIAAEDQLAAAERYRADAWEALCRRIES